jgi:hypothetical protein
LAKGVLGLLAVGCVTSGSPNLPPPSDGSVVDASVRDAESEPALAADSSQDSTRGAMDGGGDGQSPTDGSIDIPSVADASEAGDVGDAQATRDAAEGRTPLYTVQCGRSLCGLDDAGIALYRCSADLGVTGSCGYFSTPCANPYPFYCGGPENCVSSASCCQFGGGSSCVPLGSCPGANGSVICHDGGDCATGEACCPLADASSFRICTAGPCR